MIEIVFAAATMLGGIIGLFIIVSSPPKPRRPRGPLSLSDYVVEQAKLPDLRVSEFAPDKAAAERCYDANWMPRAFFSRTAAEVRRAAGIDPRRTPRQEALERLHTRRFTEVSSAELDAYQRAKVTGITS